MKYVFIFLCFVVLQCCNQSSSENNITQKIADANGINNFKKVDVIEFTFNAQRDTAHPSSRHWQWAPKTNEVVFITDSNTTKFKRDDTSTAALKKLNARFTNDEYWLLYPFHLIWDKGYEMQDSSMKTAPISGKSLRKISSKYNGKEGYTPGDMYDVYVDENNRIQEWAYHQSAAAEPALVTTWENYKEFNGLQISQDHKSKDGKFHIWFKDIKIKNN